jgi:hypothetical protein
MLAPQHPRNRFGAPRDLQLLENTAQIVLTVFGERFIAAAISLLVLPCATRASVRRSCKRGDAAGIFRPSSPRKDGPLDSIGPKHTILAAEWDTVGDASRDRFFCA